MGAGYSFARLGMHTARHGWEGLEFAAGIPGSVGGAVYMNAGACGGETADCLQSVDYLHANGELHHYPCQELSFAYRSSPFQKMSGAIVRATFQLCPAEAVRERQRQQIDYRTTTQPYGEKSAGCMFRNPKGDSAGALIEAAKLKGLSCGDAQVSEKHANFIVNKGEARSSDVLALIDEVRKQVESKTGKSLESEVHYVPYHPKELS